MSTRVLRTFWRLSSSLRRSHSSSLTSANIFERLPREELVTKFKSRLRGRQFLPGSSGADFPEFLAEPRDSFPLGVRVKNKNQSSLAELTVKCMEFVEENLPLYPVILFRGLPAKTAGDFSIIAKAIPFKSMEYKGGNGIRLPLDKDARVYAASEEPDLYTIEMHNEMAYSNYYFPSKVSEAGCRPSYTHMFHIFTCIYSSFTGVLQAHNMTSFRLA